MDLPAVPDRIRDTYRRARQTVSKHMSLSTLALAVWAVMGVQAGDESTLRSIEQQRQAAIRDQDFGTLSKIYAEDFTGIPGNGSVITRTQLFDTFKKNDARVVFTSDDVRVRIIGSTALFTGRLTGRTASGSTVSAGRFTHVFEKRDGAWVCVHGQSTPIPQ
jgi:ketosteroid isomerase-like protein